MSSTSHSLLDTIDTEEELEPIVPVAKGTSTKTGVSFACGTDETSIEVVDPVDRNRYTLRTNTTASPTPTDTEKFLFPVDAAIEVTTDGLSLPTVVPVCVRDPTGEPIVRTEHFANQELSIGIYSIELCAPVRIYLRVESTVRIVSDTNRTRIEFSDLTPVEIGARSRREHPAVTVTTTDDPEDLMTAISTFGSALATTSPERSLPSFRGHPPLIERGDELDIPDGLAPPETGLLIEVPPEYHAIYVVAPLAYYLGARIVPGEVPRIIADTGFEHRLDTAIGSDGSVEARPEDRFETEVTRVLKQTFLLDCVTRTEGIYPVKLRERSALADHLDFDLAELYDRPLAERVEAYLAVPFGKVKLHLPDWKLTAHIAPTPESVESLPFAVNDLAVIRTPHSDELSVSEERAATIGQQTEAVDDFLRSASRGGTTGLDLENYVDPSATDSLESVWIGDGQPLNGSKATAEAYRNRLDRDPTEGDIDVTVVCNDIDHTGDGRAGMDDERAATEAIYGSPLSLPFEVSVHHDLTTEELRDMLAADTDFLHYIGHVNKRGFECIDGILDAKSLNSVGADAFFLNACQSYDQGMAMIDAGAIGGIVTQIDVVNEGALAIGKAVTRLLNAGFPLGAALEVARSEAVAGERYLVVGDQRLTITQAESVTPNMCVVDTDGDSCKVEFKTYPTTKDGLGSVIIPYFEQTEEYYLNSGTIDTFDVSREELYEFLSLDNIPVQMNGDLYWSGSLDFNDL